MLKSYEAVYDHGAIRWLGEVPDVEEARLIVTVIPQLIETTDTKALIPIPDKSDDGSGVATGQAGSPQVVSITRKRRIPPPELKGSITWIGDPFEPAISEEEWEASFERTARQLEGDPEAFK